MNRRHPRRKGRSPEKTPFALKIEQLGAHGDGIGQCEGRPIYVFDALPGKELEVQALTEEGGGLRAKRVRLRRQHQSVLPPPARTTAAAAAAIYSIILPRRHRTWKRALLVAVLTRWGFGDAESKVAPLDAISAGQRRRVSWALRRSGKGMSLGFRSRASHRIVDQEHCLQLLPALQEVPPALRNALQDLLSEGEEARQPPPRPTAASTFSWHCKARPTWLCAKLLRRLPSGKIGRGSLSATPAPSWSRWHRDACPWCISTDCRWHCRRRPFCKPEKQAKRPSPASSTPPSSNGSSGCGLLRRLRYLHPALLKRGHSVIAAEGNASALVTFQSAARRAGFDEMLSAEVRDLEIRPLDDTDLGMTRTWPRSTGWSSIRHAWGLPRSVPRLPRSVGRLSSPSPAIPRASRATPEL